MRLSSFFSFFSIAATDRHLPSPPPWSIGSWHVTASVWQSCVLPVLNSPNISVMDPVSMPPCESKQASKKQEEEEREEAARSMKKKKEVEVVSFILLCLLFFHAPRKWLVDLMELFSDLAITCRAPGSRW